jgi:hypothetical protein
MYKIQEELQAVLFRLNFDTEFLWSQFPRVGAVETVSHPVGGC